MRLNPLWIVWKVCLAYLPLCDTYPEQSGGIGSFFLPSGDEMERSIRQSSNGYCTYEELMLENRRCETVFFSKLTQTTNQTCHTLIRSMQICIQNKFYTCWPDDRNEPAPKSQTTNELLEYSLENICNYGALPFTSRPVPVNYCSTNYESEAIRCMKLFTRLYRKHQYTTKTCLEYQKAKNCLYDVQDTQCKLLSPWLYAIQNVTREFYRCWNPFCKNTPSVQGGPNRGVPADCKCNDAVDNCSY